MNEKILCDIEEKISSKKSNQPLGIFLEGGHYNPRIGCTDFSQESLLDATKLATQIVQEYKRKVRIVMSVLLDDLGLICSNTSRSCSIDTTVPMNSTSLPYELENILNSSIYIKPDRIVLMREKTAKNRGINTLKNLIKVESPHIGEAIQLRKQPDHTELYFLADDGSEILIGEYNHESKWVAKCPTIMAQHYTDAFAMIKTRFPEVAESVIVDFSEMPDQNKVQRGSELCLSVFHGNQQNDSIINIFYHDSRGTRKKYIKFEKDDY